MAPTGKTRITVANKNVPNVISNLTAAIGGSGLNIDDMINKAKGDYAYNIIDVSGEVSADLVAKLQAVEGVINVRIIPNCQ
jgi:D-3-phosphoglycerate dehydrogenase